ncbi:MAG: DUF2167 domain-containing protein [Bacteroidota bacterium]
MKTIHLILLMLMLMSTQPIALFAQNNEEEPLILDSTSDSSLAEMFRQFAIMDSIEGTLVYDSGTIVLGNELATLVVPEGYKYLGQEQSHHVLTELWGNPPAPTLGLIFPKEATYYDMTYAIEISYEEIGHVEDDDANDIDYDELLEDMQKGARDGNEERIRLGYEPIELLGWASPPYYDATEKKLHWAKSLRFGSDSIPTLNYNIRMLGRKGVLVMNYISDIEQLANIKDNMPAILNSVSFNEGQQYRDFDPDLDEIAAVGIGGLIAGKVLAKGGFFVFLAKAWKFLALGAVALFGFFKRLLRGSKKEDSPNK